MIKTNKIIVNGIEGDLRQGGWKVSGRIDGDTDLVSEGQNLRLMAKSNAGRDDTESPATQLEKHSIELPEPAPPLRHQLHLRIVFGD